MTNQFFFVSLILLTVSIFSCTSDPSGSSGQDAGFHSGLYMEHMDTTVHPGNDFQMYVNGAWIKNAGIPADKSSYGIGAIVHEQSQENVRTIIEEAAAANAEPGSPEQKVGDLFASYMNMEKRNERGVTPLQAEFSKIDGLADHKELAAYFAYANKLGYAVPFNLAVYPDLKNPEINALYTWQGGLGLPEREYYLSDAEDITRIRNAYVDHIATMMELAGLDGATEAAKEIMALETSMAREQMKKEDTRNMVKLYNIFPVDSLDVLMPDFAWSEYFSEAGVPDLEKVGIAMVDYTKALNDIIHNTGMNTWKTYLKWTVINETASYLNEEMDAKNFAFFGKVLNGREEQLPQWRRGVNFVNNNLGEAVGKVYVAKHFPPEAKARMNELVDNLLKAYEVSIKELDWMGEETKKEALDKLSKFTPKIGYPDKWREYPAEIKSDDLFGNLKRSKMAEYEREIKKAGQPVDRAEWQMTPQTVNAYYNPPMNEIVFPAAILQPPFFDLQADDAVNYGAIGGVIGHEIGHGFDDQGSTFDGDGVLRNWWTDQDREEFSKRTATLIDQYNQFEVLDGINVNGQFTLGENIGDLGGLSIALKAYEISLNGKEAPVIDGFTGTQRVFLGWAQAWRKKSREEALKMQVNTDPHSPADFRVNGVVRNIPEFYTAFNVKPGDALYLDPEERVKIW